MGTKQVKKSWRKEDLMSSSEYKDWIGSSRVVSIHDTYHDSGDDYSTYIVIHADKFVDSVDCYNITRFFKMNDKVYVSQDHFGITCEDVVNLLLTDYTGGLK